MSSVVVCSFLPQAARQVLFVLALSLLLGAGSLFAHDHDCGADCQHAVVWENGEPVELMRCDGPPPMQEFVSFTETLSLAYLAHSLDANEPSGTVPESGDVEIDALRAPQWNAYHNAQSTVITYSFYSDSVHGGAYYGDEANVHEVSEAVKANFRDIMNRLNQILDIEFLEVAETAQNWGQIRLMNSDGPSYAYAYYPTALGIHSVASDIHLSPSYNSGTNYFGSPPGSHGYMSLIHELGHALGMKHPHDTSSGSFTGLPTMPSDRDNTIWTSMSYTFSNSLSTTFMALDIKFLHHAYSYALSTLNEGDTTITIANSNADRHSQGGAIPGTNNIRQALFNPGGTNTVTLSGTSAGTNYIADLNPRGWIRRSNVTNRGIMFADNTIISRVVAGPGHTALYSVSGNPTTFIGYAPGNAVGNDVIHNAVAGDVIDLGDYTIETCIETVDGDDALFTMAGDGSVRVKDYWGLSPANRPTIIRPPSDGTVAFTAPAFSVAEDAGTLSMSVNRLGSAGAASVDYATSDGTAQAGVHYTAVSGTLSWADGEDGLRTIEIPIIDNLVAETQDPSFTVSLSNPQGVVVHTPSTATITIEDNNAFPEIDFITPTTTQIGIPSGMGLIVEVEVSVDPQQPGVESVTWSVIEAPDGAVVDWDDEHALHTGMRFSHDGSYQLQVQVSDGTNVSTSMLNLEVGSGGGMLPPQESLAVWLKLDESSGTIAADASGNDRDGTLSGDPVWRPSDGAVGGALRFTANNQLVTLADSTGLDNVNRMSWSWWMRPTSNNNDVRGILSKRSGASSGQCWSFFLHNDNQLTLDIPSSSNRIVTPAIPANEWTHITVVFDGTLSSGSRVRLYRDGVLANTYSASITSIPNQSNSVTLGIMEGNNGSFRGDIDEVLIYHGRALSDEEVSAIYQATGNLGPEVAIISGATAVAGEAHALDATIDDDGLPDPPGVVSSLWRHHSGSGSVAFADASAVQTTVQFAQAGEHVLRLEANDGAVTTFAQQTLEVISGNPAGTLVFAVGTRSVAEDAGSLDLVVRRIGGDEGAISIDYASSDGSAQAGVHYTSVSGSLAWADGDAADKIITVPILVDASDPDDRTFSVTLADISGDADLGSPSEVVVTIVNTVYWYAPIITQQPQSLTAFVGQPFTLSVQVDASPSPEFQWYRDGEILSGATAASYTVAETAVEDAGSYHVVVSNSEGSVTSDTVEVSVTEVDPDLIAWWKLDDATGTQASDSTANNHHGSLVNLNGDSAWVEGRIAGALDFSGSGYVETDKTASQLGIAGSASRTVAVWAKTRSFNNGALFQVGADSGGNMFSLRTTGTVNEWRIQYWGGDHDFTATDYGVESHNRWVHFAHVYVDGQTRIYLNGEHHVTFDRVINTNDGVSMRLGLYRSDNYYNGILDDVRLYGRALTTEEIIAIYNAGRKRREIVIGIQASPSPEWQIDPDQGSYEADGFNRIFRQLFQDTTYTLYPQSGEDG